MIYTALFGEKDEPRTDIKMFTAYDRFKDPLMNAKIYKVLFHKFIEDEYSIWVDANVHLKHEEEWYYDLLEDKGIAVATHPATKNFIEEADLCKRVGRGVPEEIDEQVQHYKNHAFNNEKQPQCCMLIRRNTPKMRELCEAWWAEICRYSYRDQISFPYIFGDYAKYLPNKNHNDNEYFIRTLHKDEIQS